MQRKVHCGRLFINKDGIVKKLELVDGGGIRDYTLSHIDMGFDEIHDRLRELFSIDPTNRNSKVYDFKCEELDTNRYQTFLEYVIGNGLKFRGTLLYLCTWGDNQQTSASTSPEKRRSATTTTSQAIQTPAKVTKRVLQVEADSSTSSVIIKNDASSPRNHRSSEESLFSNHISENLRMTSFANYSFTKSLHELIDYLHHLLTQYNHETIFIQLFEYICTVQGLSSITLDPLKQQMQSTDEQQKYIYNDAIDKIENLSGSIKALIELNKIKISHVDQQSIITKSFNQFHQNFNILRDRWNNKVNNNQETTYISSTSISSTSSSPHDDSETNSRKQTRSSSPSFRTLSEQNNNESFSLFKNLLKSLDHFLSDVLRYLRYSSFDSLVRLLITEAESCRSSINLSDTQSLHDARQLITSLEARLTNRLNDERHRASPHGIHRQIESSFNQTLESIKHLLTSLQYYQDLMEKNKPRRKTRWSSPPRQEYTENKPVVNSDQHRVKLEDDQSSEASHSSFGDEVLMDEAKDSVNTEPNRFK